ncbi:MAG: universal stress protein [Gammaproteobacteria bacterium]
MAYRSILVHVSDAGAGAPSGAPSGASASTADPQVDAAIALARDMQAHLTGMAASGISRTLFPTLPDEQEDPTLALHLGFVREQGRAALARFSDQCTRAVLPSWEARLVDDEAAAGLSLHARAADVTVLSQQDPAAATPDNLAADVIMQCGGPVLLLPHAPLASAPVFPCRHALVAWDASREAARALQGALPLLVRAHQVTVALIDTLPSNHASLDARAADPLPMLARHGVQAQRVVRTLDAPLLPHRRHPVGDTLLALCAELQADLLVMGAYAHSRWRETLLGGVTRTILERMNLPVLMVH